ncbi:MAG: hypothetical protein ACPH25_04395 [Schleiferiaceae bacterium]
MRVFANAFALDYTLNYNYSTSNPHQLEDVLDSKNSVQSNYLYNSSGSIKEIQDPMAGGPQTFYWNEERRRWGMNLTLQYAQNQLFMRTLFAKSTR